MGELRSFRQNGERLVVTEVKLEHQRRQIFRRELRKKLKVEKKNP